MKSLDYTPSRLPEDTRCVVVQMYMAHHQAMAIVAIANVLNGGAMRARFHAEPMVRRASYCCRNGRRATSPSRDRE